MLKKDQTLSEVYREIFASTGPLDIGAGQLRRRSIY